MSEPSRARAFYEAVKKSSSPFAYLASMMGKPLENFEGEYLDFKGAARLDVKGCELRKIWSKALSGFANSDGGVVVWGIDAPKNVPQNLSLVPDLKAFNARLLELLPNAADPPVQNVETLPIAQPESSNTGFIVCLIPRSPWKPHRAKFAGDKYYIRAGDSHVPASHSVLRSLFHPERESRIGIYFQVTKKRGSQITVVTVSFWLKNEGPATAEDVFILCKTLPAVGITLDKVWRATTSAYPGTAGYATRPFHPTEMIKLFGVRLGDIDPQGKALLKSRRFDFEIYLKNQVPQRFLAEILEEDLNNDRVRVATRVE